MLKKPLRILFASFFLNFLFTLFFCSSFFVLFVLLVVTWDHSRRGIQGCRCRSDTYGQGFRWRGSVAFPYRTSIPPKRTPRGTTCYLWAGQMGSYDGVIVGKRALTDTTSGCVRSKENIRNGLTARLTRITSPTYAMITSWLRHHGCRTHQRIAPIAGLETSAEISMGPPLRITRTIGRS